MGLYQRKGVDDSGRFYYVQEDSKDNGYFLYYCLRTKAWYLSPSLRGSACVLVNYSISLDVPTNNWRYRREGEWFVDPGLSVTSYNGHLPCSKITVALNEDVMEDLKDIEGGYIPTTDFSMGRKVFKHTDKEIFLRVIPGRTDWIVEIPDIMSIVGNWSASGLCPVYQWNRPSSGRSEVKRGVNLKCDIHDS